MSTEPADGFTSRLATLHKALERDRGLIGRLEAVAALARRTIADCDAAGLSVIAKGRAWTVAASDEVVLEVDLVQYDTGEGPCLEAIRKSDLVRLDVDFDGRLGKVYDEAMSKGLWKGTAAARQRVEYWTAGVEAYFDAAGTGLAHPRPEPPLDGARHVPAARFSRTSVNSRSVSVSVRAAVGSSRTTRRA